MNSHQNEMQESKYRRRPWRAVVLSLLMPGGGHVYCGKLVRGLIFACLIVLILPAMAVTQIGRSSTQTVVFVLAALLSGVVVPIIAAVDSFRIARHTRHDYQLKEYNRWYVYVLLLTLISGGGVGYSLHIRARYAQAFVIPSSSMYPTIMHGDRVLASKIAYASADPARGDIIVFPNPNNRRQRYVKRVVALEGDTVEITGGVLIINGQPLARRTLAPMSSAPKTPDRSGTVFEEINGAAVYKVYVATDREGLKTKTDLPLTTVPKYHCFVLGDNRDSSCDSRAFGAVPLVGIIGRANFLYAPARDWSRFGTLD